MYKVQKQAIINNTFLLFSQKSGLQLPYFAWGTRGWEKADIGLLRYWQ